jgi:hypothetical protein
MKFITSIALAILSLGLASCLNTGFVGHRYAYDINAEFKSDMSAPVAMNAGFESHSAAAVPPEHSLSVKRLRNSEEIATGEVLSTISRLSIERTSSNPGMEFDCVTVAATGDAADNATKNKAASMAAKAQEDPSTPGIDVATQIATSPSSIR